MHGTILVIDDSRLVQKLYRHRLNLASYDAKIAGTGEEGLDILGKQHIDLVLLDLGLPSMNGLKVLETIKQDPATEHIPVIVFSAREQESLVESALKLGADEFMTKTTTKAQQVVDKIDSILSARRARLAADRLRLALDPQALDAVKLATKLGLEGLSCRGCGGDLVLELRSEETDSAPVLSRFEARLVCSECGRTP